jgi:serine/threonine protein kinase
MDRKTTLPKKWDGWKIEEAIGDCSYGTVYRAVNTATKQVSAVKVISIPHDEEEQTELFKRCRDVSEYEKYLFEILNRTISEIKALTLLENQENIVPYEDYYVDIDKENGFIILYIRMPLMTPLSKWLVTHEMNEAAAASIGIQISRALAKCHKRMLLHRDIKPKNIMLDSKENFCLGDFGTAACMELDRRLELSGSYSYMAPEVYHMEKYDALADQY